MSACQTSATSNTTHNTNNGTAATVPKPVPPTLLPNEGIDKCPTALDSIPGCLTPHQLREAYGVENLYKKGWTGKGQTVIDVVSFGSPTLKQDMDTYDQTFGLPPIDLQVISPLHETEYNPGNSRSDKAGWAGETTLDVQVIHAIAPEAKVIVMTSPVAETEGTVGLPEFLQLEQYAIDHHLGSIFSQSWGASELTLQDQKGQQELQKWNAFYLQATMLKGMTIFNSSGDNGAADYSDLQSKHLSTTPTTSFAGDSPWVTAVGGTTLTHTGTNFTEQAWSNSGGGFSRFYMTPDYQKNLPADAQSQAKNRRGVPDVAADANPNTGMAVYQGGMWNAGGGTSASAPVWAGLMAIANQMAGHPLGFINPALYKLASQPATYARDFHDVTQGNNSFPPANVQGYAAAKGWDAVTGLGTPNAENLLPDLVAAMHK
jgi:subtilase family serine protease